MNAMADWFKTRLHGLSSKSEVVIITFRECLAKAYKNLSYSLLGGNNGKEFTPYLEKLVSI